MADTSSSHTCPSPVLGRVPPGADPRLLDAGLLHAAASGPGLAERYARGATPHTIHVWWARRPHTAMRALVFSALCRELSPESNEILKSLGESLAPGANAIQKARGMLSRQYGAPPAILDMFGGGGTIAFEAARLGARAFSMDSNELAVFIQKTLLEYSQETDLFAIPDLVRKSGARVLERLAADTSPYFPARRDDAGPVHAYVWTYSMKCRECGYRFHLCRRPWLSRKKGRETILEFLPSEKGQAYFVSRAAPGHRRQGAWKGRPGKALCPRCGHAHEKVDIRQCSDALVALVRPGKGKGKEFERGTCLALPGPGCMENALSRMTDALERGLPGTELPRWSGIVNPALYGMVTHGDFLNPRQRLVLLHLIQGLREEFAALCASQGRETARCVTSLLSGLMDQLIDWNCRLSMWIPQNEQAGRAFCGPGVAMLWDYVETDPVLSGPSNLWDKLDRIAEGSRNLAIFPQRPQVRLAQAQNLPFPADSFDAIVTDPPYYDNLFYGPLADFFFSWKRMLLDLVDPVLFAAAGTAAEHELVASRQRCGAGENAHEIYCAQLAAALNEAARVLKPEGILSLVYSHGAIKGWDALVRAFRASPFVIANVQPLGIERKARPRAMSSQAVNTCLVFTARKARTPQAGLSLRELRAQWQELLRGPFAPSLAAAGWEDGDAALALFAQGAALLANAGDWSGREDGAALLREWEQEVKTVFPGFALSGRKTI